MSCAGAQVHRMGFQTEEDSDLGLAHQKGLRDVMCSDHKQSHDL